MKLNILSTNEKQIYLSYTFTNNISILVSISLLEQYKKIVLTSLYGFYPYDSLLKNMNDDVTPANTLRKEDAHYIKDFLRHIQQINIIDYLWLHENYGIYCLALKIDGMESICPILVPLTQNRVFNNIDSDKDIKVSENEIYKLLTYNEQSSLLELLYSGEDENLQIALQILNII